MGRIEDLKETAPCGMEIHYTVDENDMIAYNDRSCRSREILKNPVFMRVLRRGKTYENP